MFLNLYFFRYGILKTSLNHVTIFAAYFIPLMCHRDFDVRMTALNPTVLGVC